MPRRVTLTDRQRDALLRLPVDQADLLKHYTHSDEDLGHICQRRRAHNRFGFASQLCVLRYPGRVLAPGEVIPWIAREAEAATSNEDLARHFVVRCRDTRTILPAPSTIERPCADALVDAERRMRVVSRTG